MRTFNKTQEDRKPLVNRIQELIGKKLTYTRVPRCAYEGYGFTVTKEGNLQTDDTVSAQVIKSLIAEGLIQAPEESTGLTVSLQIGRHTAVTLRNLVNLIFTRASLLNKALGTSFQVKESLTNFLRDESGLYTAEDLRKAIAAYEDDHGSSLRGLAFSTDKIIFSTLPETEDPTVIKAFTELCSMMNKQALTQQRIQAKTVNDENEKYAMRIWLVRLGMNGSEHKDVRKILMENLTGHCAFHTEDAQKRWQARQDEKREKLKAIKDAMRRTDAISEQGNS